MVGSPMGRIWLLTPWLIIACGLPLLLWWTFEPAPVTIDYVAPAFLSQPAKSREEASRYYLSEARGGSTVWRYVEYTVHRSYEGTAHRAWVGEALVWHAPDLPTQFSRVPGSGAISIAVPVPQSSPTRDFVFVQRMEISNPLRTMQIEYQPLPLRILDSKG